MSASGSWVEAAQKRNARYMIARIPQSIQSRAHASRKANAPSAAANAIGRARKKVARAVARTIANNRAALSRYASSVGDTGSAIVRLASLLARDLRDRRR